VFRVWLWQNIGSGLRTLPARRDEHRRSHVRSGRAVCALSLLAASSVGMTLDSGCAGAAPDRIRTPATISGALAQLPPAAVPIGPLHRGADGKIGVMKPRGGVGANGECSPESICVGPDHRYRSLADALALARDGAVIEIIGGTYRESAAIRRKNVIVRGVAGRPHFDCAGIKLVDGKSCLVLGASGITLENLEISGAEIPASAGGDAACIRNSADASFALQGVICHGSQEGVVSEGGTIEIENSEFYDNGWTAATHNAYFGGNCPSVTARGSIFRDARAGSEFTSRCARTDISDSTFGNTKGTLAIDIPDGGETMVYRSTIMKSLGTGGREILGFMTASCRYPGSMVLRDVHIANARSDAEIENRGACAGHVIAFERVTFEGAMPILIGDIRRQ
jgi:hypothetical protein